MKGKILSTAVAVFRDERVNKRKGFGVVGEGLRENFQPRFELTIVGVSIQSADH